MRYYLGIKELFYDENFSIGIIAHEPYIPEIINYFSKSNNLKK